MDEILQSEIITVLLDKGGSVSMAEFAGLFHQVHGYQFKLSNYGYKTLRKLMEDAEDVQICQINGTEVIKCQVSEQIVVVFSANSSCEENNVNITQVPNESLPTSGPISGSPKSPQKHRTKVICKNTTSRLGSSSISVSSNLSSPGTTFSSLGASSGSGPSTSCNPSTKPKSTVPASKQKKKEKQAVKVCPSTENTKSAKSKTTALQKKTNAAIKNTVSKPNVNLKGSGGPPSIGQIQNNLNSCFNMPNKNVKVHQEVHPKLSYAAVCTSNIKTNQCIQDVAGSGRYIAQTPSGMQYKSTPEPKSVMPGSAMKSNLYSLLKLHGNGLPIFQLQKLYLFKFREPLTHKGFPTIKHLLLRMKDLVRLQGVGVQTLVFLVHAEDIPATAAKRNLDKTNFWNTNAHLKKVPAAFVSSSNMVPSSGLQNHQNLQLVVPSKPLKGTYPRPQDPTFTANYAERPNENALLSGHHMNPPSLQTPQQRYRSDSQAHTSNSQAQNNMDAPKNGPEQNAYKSPDLPQFILHPSGFSIIMHKINVPHDTEASRNGSHASSAFIKPSLHDSAQATTDNDNRRYAPSAHMQQFNDAHSHMFKQPKARPELITEHLHALPYQPLPDTRFAITEQSETALIVGDSQARRIHNQMEYDVSQPQEKKGSSLPAEPGTQNVRQDFHNEIAPQPSGSTASDLQDKAVNLQTSGDNGYKVSKPQSMGVLEQIVLTQSQQKVTNCQDKNKTKQTEVQHSQVKGGHSKANVDLQLIQPSHAESVLPQPQDKVLGSQTKKLSGQTQTKTKRKKRPKMKLRQLTPEAAESQEKVPNAPNKNTSVSPALYLKQNELVLQNKNLSAHTVAQPIEIKAPSSQHTKDPQHTRAPEETKASPIVHIQNVDFQPIQPSPDSHIPQKAINSQDRNKQQHTVSVLPQPQNKVLGSQTKKVSLTQTKPSCKKRPKIKLRQLTPEAADSQVANAPNKHTPVSPALHLKQKELVVQNKNLSAHTFAKPIGIKAPSSQQTKDPQHTRAPEETKASPIVHVQNTLQPARSTPSQLYDKHFNLLTSGDNGSKVSKPQSKGVLEQIISIQSQQNVTSCQVENETKQSETQQSQVIDGHSKTHVDFQPIQPSPDSHIAQKSINCQDRNEQHTESVLPQPQDKVLGSQTEKISGETEPGSSGKKQTNMKLTFAHPHEKELICHPKETMASPSTILSLGQILPVSLTPQFHDIIRTSRTNRSYLEILNPPIQHGCSIAPQNAYESSSEEKDWQTDKEQYCCIL